MATYVPAENSGVSVGVPAVIGVVSLAFAVGLAAFLWLTRSRRGRRRA